jgi:transcription elongation GreA/GreB family factor
MSDKAALRTELVAALEEALAAARAAHATAIEGATHPESKAENDKDTRGLEQSYLARGVAQRVVDLEAAVADVTRLELRTFAGGAPIAMSALVTVDEDGAEQRFFLAPAGGGTVLSGNVQVVTTSSPLGRALLGKRVDDDVELKLPGKTRAFVISAIR